MGGRVARGMLHTCLGGSGAHLAHSQRATRAPGLVPIVRPPRCMACSHGDKIAMFARAWRVDNVVRISYNPLYMLSETVCGVGVWFSRSKARVSKIRPSTLCTCYCYNTYSTVTAPQSIMAYHHNCTATGYHAHGYHDVCAL